MDSHFGTLGHSLALIKSCGSDIEVIEAAGAAGAAAEADGVLLKLVFRPQLGSRATKVSKRAARKSPSNRRFSRDLAGRRATCMQLPQRLPCLGEERERERRVERDRERLRSPTATRRAAASNVQRNIQHRVLKHLHPLPACGPGPGPGRGPDRDGPGLGPGPGPASGPGRERPCGRGSPGDSCNRTA